MNNQAHVTQLPVNLTAVMLGVFYLSTSYAFYNLNHYKLLLAWGSCLLLLTVLWGGDSLGSKHPVPRSQREPSLRLTLICLLPLLATLPGWLSTQGRHDYFFGQEAALWLMGCGWMLLLIRVLNHPQKIAAFLQWLALIVIAVSALALWGSLGDYVGPRAVPAQRESGTFGNPNYLACFLVMHIPLLGLCALSSWQSVPAWRGSFTARVIFLLATLMALLALFFTQSRVAMATAVGIIGGLVMLILCMPALFSTSVRKWGALVLAALIVAVFVCLWQFPAVVDALTSTLRSTPESRLVPWRAAWASIQDSPWLGAGPGSSYSLFFQYVDPASRLLWHERSYAHPHNEVLEILQEGGVLGLMSYLVFIGMVAWSSVRLLRSSVLTPDYKVMVAGIVCALLAYHVVGLASVDTRMAVVRFAMFTLLGVLFSIQRFAGDVRQQPGKAAATPFRNLWRGKSSPVHATVLMLLAASAALLGEDLASRHRYVGIMQQTDEPVRVQLLETLRDENPNVYALERLVQHEINNGDFANAAITLATLDSLIPNYSTSGYFRALSLWRQNRQQEARAAALAYQQRDRYFPQNAYLLAAIAVSRAEPALFLQQIQLLLTPLLQNVAQPVGKVVDVVVKNTPGATSCEATRQQDSTTQLTIVINGQVIADSMDKLATLFASVDPAAAAQDYRNVIATGIDNLACGGLDEEEVMTLRSALLQVLDTLAVRRF